MRAALFIVSLLCGCSSDASVFVSFPPRGDDIQTVVIAVEETEVPELYAFAVGPDAPLPPFRLPVEEAVQISVLYYRDTLETLSLSTGKLPQAKASDCTPYSLTEPDEHHEITARSEGMSSWQKREQLTETLAGFRFLGPCVCDTFDVQLFDTGTRSAILALTPLDDQTLLAVSYARGAPGFLVRRDGITPVDLQLPSTAGVRSAFTGSDGTIWLGGIEGWLWHGRPSTGFTAAPRTSTTVQLRTVDGAQGEAPFELYFSTKEGTLERFDGQWETLHISETMSGSGSGPSVVWLGEGHLLATLNEQVSVVEVRRGLIHETDWDLNSWSYPETLGRDGDGRVVSATYHGRFIRYLDGRWDALEEQSIGSGSIRLIMPHSNGFLFAGLDALLGTYHDRQGLCGATYLDAPVDFHVGAPLGDGIVLAGGPFAGHNSMLVLLTPQPKH